MKNNTHVVTFLFFYFTSNSLRDDHVQSTLIDSREERDAEKDKIQPSLQ